MNGDKLRTYAVKIGKELFRTTGRENAKGFLEWKCSDGSGGISAPGKFCIWNDRKLVFADCQDAPKEQGTC